MKNAQRNVLRHPQLMRVKLVFCHAMSGCWCFDCLLVWIVNEKIVSEPTWRVTPFRSCKISGIASWIFEIHVLGCLRIIKKGQ